MRANVRVFLRILEALVILGMVAFLASSAVRRRVGVALVSTGVTLQNLPQRVPSQESEKVPDDLRLKHLEDSETRFQTYLSLVVIVLTALALMIALLSYFGLQWLRDKVTEEVRSATERKSQELSGRIWSVYSVVFGRLCRDQDDVLIPGKEFFLEQAIDNASRALTELEAAKEKTFIWRVRNNLAYYLSLNYNPAFADQALELADQLRSGYPRRQTDHWIDTYARVICTYARHSQGLRDKLEFARDLLRDRVESHDLGERRKGVFRLTLSRVETALKILPSEQTGSLLVRVRHLISKIFR